MYIQNCLTITKRKVSLNTSVTLSGTGHHSGKVFLIKSDSKFFTTSKANFAIFIGSSTTPPNHLFFALDDENGQVRHFVTENWKQFIQDNFIPVLEKPYDALTLMRHLAKGNEIRKSWNEQFIPEVLKDIRNEFDELLKGVKEVVEKARKAPASDSDKSNCIQKALKLVNVLFNAHLGCMKFNNSNSVETVCIFTKQYIAMLFEYQEVESAIEVFQQVHNHVVSKEIPIQLKNLFSELLHQFAFQIPRLENDDRDCTKEPEVKAKEVKAKQIAFLFASLYYGTAKESNQLARLLDELLNNTFASDIKSFDTLLKQLINEKKEWFDLIIKTIDNLRLNGANTNLTTLSAMPNSAHEITQHLCNPSSRQFLIDILVPPLPSTTLKQQNPEVVTTSEQQDSEMPPSKKPKTEVLSISGIFQPMPKDPPQAPNSSGPDNNTGQSLTHPIVARLTP